MGLQARLWLQFFQAAHMTATLEISAEKGAHRVLCLLDADNALADRDDVGVVVLTGKARGGRVPAEGATDASHLVRHHLLPIARAAEDNTAVRFTPGDRLGGRPDVVRVVHRSLGVRTEILDLVTQLFEQGDHRQAGLPSQQIRLQ